MSWPLVKLSDVCTFMTGGTPSKALPEYFDGGEIPWILSGDINRRIVTDVDGRITAAGMENSPAKFLPLNSVLIALNGQGRTRATVALLKLEGATCNQSIVAMSPKSTETLHHEFLFSMLRSMYQHLRDLTGDDKRSGLTIGILKNVEIPLPPLAEQKRIAGILDAADALRAKRREALAQLDTLLQATFLDLFGDPVTNPKGWKTTELAALIEPGDKINYGVVQPGEDHPNGHPLVRVGDLEGGELTVDGVKLIDPKIEKKYRRSRLNGRELLVSCVGSIGTVCKVPASAKGFNVARAVARVPLVDAIERDFVVHCLRTSAVQRHFQKETRTVSQPTLNIAVIKTAPIIQPPEALQSRFSRFAESVEVQRTQQRAHLAELDILFASLQSLAFRGELDAR